MEKIKEIVESFPLWAAALAMWGGIVAYLQKVVSSEIPFSWLRLLMEMSTSAFVGVLAFYACESFRVEGAQMALLVAVSGHMGTKALSLIETYLEKLIKRNVK